MKLLRESVVCLPKGLSCLDSERSIPRFPSGSFIRQVTLVWPFLSRTFPRSLWTQNNFFSSSEVSSSLPDGCQNSNRHVPPVSPAACPDVTLTQNSAELCRKLEFPSNGEILIYFFILKARSSVVGSQ